MSVQLRPLGDRVLIKPDQAQTLTASGLHLAEHPQPEQTGTVLAVGRLVDLSVKPGDYVVFSWAAGQSLRIDDQDGVCLVLRESDLLCVVGEGVTVEARDPNREVAV